MVVSGKRCVFVFMAWVIGSVVSFWMGFGTACIVAAAWAIVYRQQNPKHFGDLKGFVMDHETGELRRDDETEAP